MSDPHVVYLDSNIFVHALEGQHDTDEVAVRCATLLDRVRSDEIVGVTSELTLAEVLIQPSIQQRFNLKRAYFALFDARRTSFQLRPVTRAILLESIEYRARVHPTKPGPTENKRNFLPDAIHVVTAIEAEATFFVSSDQRIRLPDGMERLDPRGSSLGAFLDRIA